MMQLVPGDVKRQAAHRRRVAGGVTDPAHPRVAASVPIADARSVYVARTYAYVGGGAQGMVIVDVEKPEQPRVDQVFGGELGRDIPPKTRHRQ